MKEELLPEILKAELRIRPHILTTPLLHSLPLSQNGANVYLKLENEQYTGSFKARGSMSKILALTAKERKYGVVTASTGNHGQGIARAAREAGIDCVVFVPENADPSKIEAIEQYGARIQHTQAGISETISHGQAKRYANEHHMAWVSPYNDLQVIAGQGTIAIELLKQLTNIDCVFVTVGGGGLVSGIATYLNAVSPKTKVVGCLPENAREMYQCVQAGKFISVSAKPTISDGSAGGFEESSITLPLCQDLIKDWTLVSEGEIKDAMKFVLSAHHKLIEGAAGVAVASYLKRKEEFIGKNIVILLCGSNIAPKTLKTLL